MLVHRQLTEGDELADFDCGIPSLNDWLANTAQRSHRQGITRVYVWVDDSQPHRVLAYSAIQPTQVAAHDVSRSVAGGHSAIPGYLIARLALHRELHGQGLGSQLLISALEVCVAAAEVGGGRVIVVDPIDDQAAAFYSHFDFISTKGSDGRLVMKVTTAAAALG